MTGKDWNVILQRELRGVRAQLAAYDTDAQVWALPPGLQNAGGTLALHLAGNLRHFIGATLGGTGYVRDRDAEFQDRDVPRGVIDQQLTAAMAEVGEALPGISPEQMDAPFTLAGEQIPTRVALAHLAAHLAYHLGQMDYHRRVVTGRADGLGMVSPKGLA